MASLSQSSIQKSRGIHPLCSLTFRVDPTAPRPISDKIHHLVPGIVGHPPGLQVSPSVFFLELHVPPSVQREPRSSWSASSLTWRFSGLFFRPTPYLLLEGLGHPFQKTPIATGRTPWGQGHMHRTGLIEVCLLPDVLSGSLPFAQPYSCVVVFSSRLPTPIPSEAEQHKIVARFALTIYPYSLASV